MFCPPVPGLPVLRAASHRTAHVPHMGATRVWPPAKCPHIAFLLLMSPQGQWTAGTQDSCSVLEPSIAPRAVLPSSKPHYSSCVPSAQLASTLLGAQTWGQSQEQLHIPTEHLRLAAGLQSTGEMLRTAQQAAKEGHFNSMCFLIKKTNQLRTSILR